MKSIIAGVRYDTDKATLIGETSNDNAHSVTDFNYWRAGLYKTPRSGRYFLAGEGGARTMFCHQLGQNSWSGGEKVIPLESEAAAFEWAQQELPADVVEQHFAHLIEDA